MKKYTRVLTIAGSDSGGGAGIQADLKTFSALGCYGMSVITALTAQNTVTVKAIYSVPPEFVAEQIDAVMEDIGADAVKIGMLHTPELIRTIQERLVKHRVEKIILDPVMVAKSGDRLLQEEALDALKKELLPLASLITPNLPEASVLLGKDLQPGDMESAARELAELGPQAVLVKGGHLHGETSEDILFLQKTNQIFRYSAKRIQTPNIHGTGCTLSSAIASFYAKGYSLQEAVGKAKEYLTDALVRGSEFQTGKGHGPVHHFYQFWD